MVHGDPRRRRASNGAGDLRVKRAPVSATGREKGPRGCSRSDELHGEAPEKRRRQRGQWRPWLGKKARAAPQRSRARIGRGLELQEA